MDTNKVTPEWSCSRFWSDCISSNENYVTSITIVLFLMLGVNMPLGGL